MYPLVGQACIFGLFTDYDIGLTEEAYSILASRLYGRSWKNEHIRLYRTSPVMLRTRLRRKSALLL